MAEISEAWLKKCAAAANALPRAKRQEFLDLMWKGDTLGENSEKLGISFEAACGIMNANIENMKTLRREAV